MGKRAHELGEAELEVMTVLWDRGPATVREVLGALHAKGRKLAYTTVQTVLTRLGQKGFVASDTKGTAHVYRAKVTRERVRKNRMRALVSSLFDGAPGAMALHLMQSERLSRDEIAEIRRLLDELEDRSGGAGA